MGLNEGIHDTISGEIYVQTEDIRECAVTTAKLKDGILTTAKLSECAVTTAKLGNSAVTTAKIGDGAVDTTQLAGSAITPDKVANSVGKWYSAPIVPMGGAGTSVVTFTATAAVTIIECIAVIVSAGENNGTSNLTMQTTTAVTIGTIVGSTAGTYKSTSITTLSAGGSLEIATSASMDITAGGTFLVHYIAT